ncbi:MAG TPA: tyrosine-type recombinase/integrase [Syntrophomonas sp.]|nr:tyrosine-type recombinase/integrase [Syntrophomonas sp.]
MEGYFRRRGCVCWKAKCTCGAETKKDCACGASKKKIKKCTCGAKWSFTIDGPDKPDGSRGQITRSGFDTRNDAETAATAIRYEVDQGTYIKESDITFEDFSKEWLVDYAVTNQVKKGTLRIRQKEINNLIPYLGHYAIKEITKRMYQNALNSLHAAGYAYNTMCGVNSTGKMVFRRAKEWELIKGDPTESARVPKTVKTVEQIESQDEIPKYLEKAELLKFLDAIKDYRKQNDYVIFRTLVYTGLRVGELAALKDTDIMQITDEISITKTIYNPKSNVRMYDLETPKTESSIRKIVVDSDVMKEINHVIWLNKKEKLRYGPQYHDKGFIFTSPKYPGYPILVKTIEDKMKQYLKLADLDTSLTPHSLRHTHTSLLAEAGVGLEEIMERLGHIDDEITRKIYLHVTKTMKKEAARKFSEFMSRP